MVAPQCVVRGELISHAAAARERGVSQGHQKVLVRPQQIIL